MFYMWNCLKHSFFKGVSTCTIENLKDNFDNQDQYIRKEYHETIYKIRENKKENHFTTIYDLMIISFVFISYLAPCRPDAVSDTCRRS